MHRQLITLTVLLLLSSEAALAAKVAQVTSVRGTVLWRHGATRERVRILHELEPAQILEVSRGATLRALWYSSGTREEVRGPVVAYITPQGLRLPPGQSKQLTRTVGTPSLRGIGTALYDLRTDQQGATVQRSVTLASVHVAPQCSDEGTPTLHWSMRGKVAEVFVEVLDANVRSVASFNGQGTRWQVDVPLPPGDYTCCVRALDADGRTLDEHSARLRVFSAAQSAARTERRSRFEQHVTRQPDDVEAYLLEAGECLQQERLGEAANVLERLASRIPESPAPHAMLTSIYQRLGDQDAALRHRKASPAPVKAGQPIPTP